MKNFNSATSEDIKNVSELVAKKHSGMPFTYDNERRILNNNYHTLLISEDDNQKTTKVINPTIEQIVSSEESFVINDKSGNIFKKYNNYLKENNYKVICLNFNDPVNSDGYNILDLASNLYNNKEYDKSLEILENIGYYIFCDDAKNNIDPFWINSAINLFIGCAIYLFKKDKKIVLNDIIQLVDDINKKKIDIDIDDNPYISGILTSPTETKLSIISVFNQKFNLYATRKNLSRVISESTFDIKDIINKKIALFIVEDSSGISKNLVPMIINQIYYVCNIYKNENKINILFDNLDEHCSIKNVENIISLLSDSNINLTAFIKNFSSLKNSYGQETSEILKFYFKNLVYLYSDDIPTLELISKLCGSIEYMSDLRNIKENEALFIIVRYLPFIANL